MRSAEFDKQEVLRAAISAFAVKGFSQTSMQDLKQATGLHPGSIYCAFENKQGLLVAALAQYSEDKNAEFQALFADKQNQLKGLRAYLNQTVAELLQGGEQMVCLSQKALGELSQVDPIIEQAVAHNLAAWQKGFVEVFAQALKNGEVDDKRAPQQRAQSLVMGIWGLRTYAQTHAQPEVLDALATQLFEDVCR